MPPASVSPTHFAAGLTVLWLLGLGGIVGSFLNVVVFRTPRGQSLVQPGSRCPHCGHPIRWYDNVPVVSWLILGGRCRDCQGPISARYPAVEGLCALMFLGLGLLELGPDGFSRLLHALGSVGSSAGPADLAPHTASAAEPVLPACLRLVCHLTLLCTLLAHLLIRWDGHHRTSGLFFVPAAALGLLAGSWPGVRLVGPWPAATGGFAGLAGGLAGLLVGGVCDDLWRRYAPRLLHARGSRPACGASDRSGRGWSEAKPREAAPSQVPRAESGVRGTRLDVCSAGSWIRLSALGAIGSVLGWQAAGLMALAGMAGQLAARPLRVRFAARVPVAELVWLAGSALWIVFWVVAHAQ